VRGDIAIYSLKYQTYLDRREPDYALFLSDLHAALSAGRASPDFWLYAIGRSLMANTHDASSPVATAASGQLSPFGRRTVGSAAEGKAAETTR
jgi:hypothetical protein